MSKISKEQIILTDHTKLRLSERNIDKEVIYDCLINGEPKGILDQKESSNSDAKYKIHYRYPNKQNYDLIIVIVIDKSEDNIRVITAHPQNKERRVKK